MYPDPDRLFPADESTRTLARELYASVRDMPLICPHGHTDAGWFASNASFSDATSLLVTADPYILRLFHAHGIPLEKLGIPRVDGRGEPPASPRQAWATFADNQHLLRGTPSGFWLAAALGDVLGIHEPLTRENADRLFDAIGEKLRHPSYRPRELFDRFRIDFLATTDSPCDDLGHHHAIAGESWKARIVPTFRPDELLDPEHPRFHALLDRLSDLTREDTATFKGYLQALRCRRQAFREAGATATDHGHASAATANLGHQAASELFDKAVRRTITAAEAQVFRAQMIFEMARMSVDDGLVMQFHVGAWRGYCSELVARYGGPRGETVPRAVDFVGGLKPLLDSFGHEPDFRLILFSLDESTYSREIAPLAGVFPSVWIGSPWWFHDSMDGMERFRRRMTETPGFYKYAGFVDDTRAFLSIPARHDSARRLDASFLASLVARHRMTERDAYDTLSHLVLDLPRRAYRI